MAQLPARQNCGDGLICPVPAQRGLELEKQTFLLTYRSFKSILIRHKLDGVEPVSQHHATLLTAHAMPGTLRVINVTSRRIKPSFVLLGT